MKVPMMLMAAAAMAQNSPEPGVEKSFGDHQQLTKMKSLVKKINDAVPGVEQAIVEAADTAAKAEAPGMLALVNTEGSWTTQWWLGRSLSWPRFTKWATSGYLVQFSSDGKYMCSVNPQHHIWCQENGKNNWWRVVGTPPTLVSHVHLHNGKLLAERQTDKRALVLEDVKNPNAAFLDKSVSHTANAGYNGRVLALPTSTAVHFMSWENLQGDVTGKKSVNMAGVCAAVGTGNQGYVIVPGGALEYWPNPLASVTDHTKTAGPPGSIVLTELKAKGRYLCGTNGSQLWCQFLKSDGMPTGQWKNMNIKLNSFSFV